ncbi:hypothetical protein JOQ06_007254, partial [Pogonophryne albipinna]
ALRLEEEEVSGGSAYQQAERSYISCHPSMKGTWRGSGRTGSAAHPRYDVVVPRCSQNGLTRPSPLCRLTSADLMPDEHHD